MNNMVLESFLIPKRIFFIKKKEVEYEIYICNRIDNPISPYFKIFDNKDGIIRQNRFDIRTGLFLSFPDENGMPSTCTLDEDTRTMIFNSIMKPMLNNDSTYLSCIKKVNNLLKDKTGYSPINEKISITKFTVR